MARFIVPLVLAALVAVPLSVRAAESVYTDTQIDKCENLLKNPDEDDIQMRHVSVKCAGYKDYPFYFNEYDDMQSAYFGHLSPEIIELGGETFEVYNHVGEKIEWRLDGKGVPRAVILRYVLESFDADALAAASAHGEIRRNGEILVVSRVGQPADKTGCVTAYVDALANSDAAELARKLADEQAPTFPCGKDRPQFHGRVGEWVSLPIYNYPDPAEAK